MNWGILMGIAAALGAGMVSSWGLIAVGDVAARFRRFRHANPSEVFMRDDAPVDTFTEDDLYGLRGIPWEVWRVAGAVVGVALAYLLLAERNPFFAAFGLAGAFAPRALRAYLVRRRKVDVDRQVRDLIFLLRPALALHGGLRPALEEVAERLESGIVRLRLRFHLERAFATEPARVVEDLAVDIHSAELGNLLLGITAAKRGGMSFGEAVIRASEESGARIREDARIAIEETPVRLLLPMLLFMLPPFLVLSLYPLLARLMALLSAPGGAMGGW